MSEFVLTEVGEALERSPAAVRQLVPRARSHVQARQPRQSVDASRHREITERFLAAAAGGDIAGLIDILSPDVVLVTDGGGIKQAAQRPIHGIDKCLRWFAGVMSKPEHGSSTFGLRMVNGEPAVVLTSDSGLDSVIFVTVEGDRITALHGIRNPEKLHAL